MYKGSIDPHRLEELLNHCLRFAKQMIEQNGEFHPFGAVIVSEGTLTAVGAHMGEENPNGAEVYTFLQNAMISQFRRKEIIASAIAADVNVPSQYKSPFPDAIRVHLECTGYSRFMYLPYKISKGKADYAEFIPVDVPPVICR